MMLTVGTSHVAIHNRTPRTPAVMLWRKNTTQWTYGTPSASADGKSVFFPPSGDRRVYAQSTTTGKLLWVTPSGLTSLCESVCRNDGAMEGVLSDDSYFIIARSGSNQGASLFAFSVADGSETFNPRNTQVRRRVKSATRSYAY